MRLFPLFFVAVALTCIAVGNASAGPICGLVKRAAHRVTHPFEKHRERVAARQQTVEPPLAAPRAVPQQLPQGPMTAAEYKPGDRVLIENDQPLPPTTIVNTRWVRESSTRNGAYYRLKRYYPETSPFQPCPLGKCPTKGSAAECDGCTCGCNETGVCSCVRRK